ncbi:hypothetical protein [Colwellia piezophila]|uniref:hypothetical protein n=1 Tax=Colwellia piezophila TaxID=211668 RepID=UPI000376A054|nr:hypothetical protein [Colwellia piezophila]
MVNQNEETGSLPVDLPIKPVVKKNKLALITSLLVAVIYLILEINLNLALVETYSQSSQTLLTSNEWLEQGKRLELIGRIITGFGLSFVFCGFVYNVLCHFFHKLFFLEVKSRFLKGLLKAVVFLFLWALIAISLRVLVDVIAYSADPETKFSSVRAIMFKELYIADMLEVSNLGILNQAKKDEQHFKIVSALIPSLALVSKSINQKIAEQSDTIAATLIDTKEKKDYQRITEPMFLSSKSFADGEFDFFAIAHKTYQEKKQQLDDPLAVKKLVNAEIREVENITEDLWTSYYNDISGIDEYSLYFWSNQKKILGAHKSYYSKKKCIKQKGCRENVYQQLLPILAKNKMAPMDEDFWLGTSFYKLAKALILFGPALIEGLACDIATDQNHEECSRLYKEAFLIDDDDIKDAHVAYLESKYPFSLELTRKQFTRLAKVQKTRVKHLRNKGFQVPDDWTLHDRTIIENYFRNNIRKLLAKAEKSYFNASKVDVSLADTQVTNRKEFYQLSKIQQYFKKRLGEYYYVGYMPTDSEEHSYLQWKNAQPRDGLDFVQILNSRAEEGFKKGGLFYELGNDAIKFTLVPTIAIGLSVLSVMMMLAKIIIIPLYHRYHGKEHQLAGFIPIWIVVIPIFSIPIFASPLFNGLFTKAMHDFVNQTEAKETQLELAGSYSLGYILDSEVLLTSIAGSIQVDINRLLPPALLPKLTTADDEVYQFVKSIPGLYDSNLMVESDDVNIVLYRKQYDVLFAMGIKFNDGKVSKVTVPNIMGHKDFDLLLDSKIFFNPNYKEMFKISLLDDLRSTDFLVALPTSDSLKQSMRQRLEDKLTKMLNNNMGNRYAVTNLLPKGVTKGNVIMFKDKKDRYYTCYYLEGLDFKFIPKMLSGDNKGVQSYPCRWVI